MKDFRSRLQEELVSRCRKNPRYSLRSFAKSLGINHGILSMVLRQTRPLTADTVQKIGLSLNLTKAELNQYIRALENGESESDSRKTKMKQINQLTMDVFYVVSDWYHDAILELSRIKGFKGEARSIAKRLGITVAEAQAAVERLERVGLIEILPSGGFKETQGDTSIGIDTSSTHAALRNLQKQVLELSLKSIEDCPKADREHASMTLAIQKKDLPEARRMMKDFRRTFMSRLQQEGTEYDEVYQLATSFYPLTKSNDGEKL